MSAKKRGATEPNHPTKKLNTGLLIKRDYYVVIVNDTVFGEATLTAFNTEQEARNAMEDNTRNNIMCLNSTAQFYESGPDGYGCEDSELTSEEKRKQMADWDEPVIIERHTVKCVNTSVIWCIVERTPKKNDQTQFHTVTLHKVFAHEADMRKYYTKLINQKHNATCSKHDPKKSAEVCSLDYSLGYGRPYYEIKECKVVEKYIGPLELLQEREKALQEREKGLQEREKGLQEWEKALQEREKELQENASEE